MTLIIDNSLVLRFTQSYSLFYGVKLGWVLTLHREFLGDVLVLTAEKRGKRTLIFRYLPIDYRTAAECAARTLTKHMHYHDHAIPHMATDEISYGQA